VRRDAGRAHLKTSRNDLLVADRGDDRRLIVQGAIPCAIAYGDALTIKVAGIRNGIDHRRLPDTVRQALGNRVTKAELARLGRPLKRKDDSAYGPSGYLGRPHNTTARPGDFAWGPTGVVGDRRPSRPPR
jgi:hypothetical protein